MKKDEKKQDTPADIKKREFIEKFGKYALSAPLGGFALMTLGSSKAAASTVNENGYGYGGKYS